MKWLQSLAMSQEVLNYHLLYIVKVILINLQVCLLKRHPFFKGISKEIEAEQNWACCSLLPKYHFIMNAELSKTSFKNQAEK